MDETLRTAWVPCPAEESEYRVAWDTSTNSGSIEWWLEEERTIKRSPLTKEEAKELGYAWLDENRARKAGLL
jgi:hypothetical protein